MKFRKKKKEKKVMAEQVKMAPPWIQYVNEVKALFGKDPEITIEYNEDDYILSLFVDNQRKADALTELLPPKKDFGNITMKIVVVPANLGKTITDLYRIAFDGNPVCSEVVTISESFTNPVSYVIFQKEVVQYYNDDLSDAHGNKTTLYQEIAKDLFEKTNGIFFCTDNK